MAKFRKPTGASAEKSESFLTANNVAEQTNRLMESMDTYTKHRVECWCCGKTDSARDITEARYARELYDRGWRYVASEKFQTVGILCQGCAETADAKRGQ
jgi:hypothetical protein